MWRVGDARKSHCEFFFTGGVLTARLPQQRKRGGLESLRVVQQQHQVESDVVEGAITNPRHLGIDEGALWLGEISDHCSMVYVGRQVPKRGVITVTGSIKGATAGRQRRKVLHWQEKRQLCRKLLLLRTSERKICWWEWQWCTTVRQTLAATARGRMR
ncbi:hypothetical protein B296_00015573 [Ensete ventricosum]|uniref:Uncharacterized protein n=1 Tax=Ensete ventricosum TaxID=4639 RepID=A0A427ALI5_ENSVE|nr:hypothetical protein B296_00015573 [Ensete ventricosum]